MKALQGIIGPGSRSETATSNFMRQAMVRQSYEWRTTGRETRMRKPTPETVGPVSRPLPGGLAGAMLTLLRLPAQGATGPWGWRSVRAGVRRFRPLCPFGQARVSRDFEVRNSDIRRLADLAAWRVR